MIIVIKWGHDNYIVTMVCNQVLRIIEGSYTCIYYSIINCGSSLHLNIMNDVSSAILDMVRLALLLVSLMVLY